MSRRARPPAAYPLDDDVFLGLVRCPVGDVDTFVRLARSLLSDRWSDEEIVLAPPRWRWYRMNPCTHGDHAWDLGRSSGPGPGRWAGAYVANIADGAEAERLERLMRPEGQREPLSPEPYRIRRQLVQALANLDARIGPSCHPLIPGGKVASGLARQLRRFADEIDPPGRAR